MAMLPTPPAPPISSSASPVAASPRGTCNATNSISQAVIAVSGSAAAAANDSEAGFGPTMRSSTSCSSLLLPWRSIAPA
jgi:hypothetical protein